MVPEQLGKEVQAGTPFKLRGRPSRPQSKREVSLSSYQLSRRLWTRKMHERVIENKHALNLMEKLRVH